jgi:DNA-binding LytR/AlgR family response regulator
MKTLNCILVDDEPLALEILERHVLKTPFLHLSGMFTNAFDAIEALHNQTIHVVFLDIQMPDLNGIEFSKSITKETRVIFTTAFNKYAIEGFKVNALDYLLKPIDYNEFVKASLKAKEWFDLVNRDEASNANLQMGDELMDEDAIFVKSEHKHLKINLKNILYFEGLKDYVKIWLNNQPKPILTIMSLKSIEENLTPNRFMRIHRSFIISLDKITSIEKGQVIIAGDRCITIADQYKDKFQSYLNAKMIS